MLPRLQAEEQLAGVRVGALAAGSYPKEDARQLIEALDLRAQGGARQQRARAQKATSADLAGMGIGAVSVPVSAPAQRPLSDG